MAGSVKNREGVFRNDLKKGVAQYIPTSSGGVTVGAIMAFGTQLYNDSTNIIKLSSTQVKLLAGKKYYLEASIHGDLAAVTYMYYNWFNVTTGLNIGNAGCGVATTYAVANAVQNTLASAYLTVPVDTVIELKITTIATGTITIFTSGHIIIEEVEAYIPVLSGSKVAITKNVSGVITYPMEDLGAGIIESGSNSNGSWIKFSDGTMICWGITSQVTVSTANGYIFMHNSLHITYPLSFIVAPITEGSAIWVSGGVTWCTNTNNVTNGCNLAFASSSSGAVCYGKWLAIGRWK